MQNTVQAILTALLNRIQECEDAAWELLSSMTIDAGSGDLLDKIGKLVGEPRNGKVDNLYKMAIKLRIRVNRSRGRTTDIVDVAMLASPTIMPKYTEGYPAGWQVDFDNLAIAGDEVSRKLWQTKAAGTYGVTVFSITSGDWLEWADSVTMSLGSDPSADQMWADSVGPSGPVWRSGQTGMP